MILSIDEIIYELEHYYDKKHSIFTKSKKDIINFFEAHVKNKLQKVKAKTLVDKYQDSEILIDTPDGIQLLGDFYIKKPRNIIKVQTVNNFSAKVSEDHLFETTKGWKNAKNIQINDHLITRSGTNKVKAIKLYAPEIVYDWEVLHENHRYWAGNGISSHNTGKTFLALNGVRQAQKLGYHIIYCDSEAAVDEETFRKFGCDPDNIRYQPVNTPLDFKKFVTNLLKMINEAKEAKKTVPKILLVLDSLGNLATTKERTDALTGSDKKDMTKAQEMRSLFRIITMDLAGAKIPFIMTAHTYACVLGETEVLMNNGTYKNISDIKKGEFVNTLNGKQEVTNTFEYDVNEVVELEFNDGFKLTCTKNHKLAVLDEHNNIVYKTVDELKECDDVIKQ